MYSDKCDVCYFEHGKNLVKDLLNFIGETTLTTRDENYVTSNYHLYM